MRRTAPALHGDGARRAMAFPTDRRCRSRCEDRGHVTRPGGMDAARSSSGAVRALGRDDAMDLARMALDIVSLLHRHGCAWRDAAHVSPETVGDAHALAMTVQQPGAAMASRDAAIDALLNAPSPRFRLGAASACGAARGRLGRLGLH